MKIGQSQSVNVICCDFGWQILMAGPLYMLYEITVWIAWYWDQPDRAKARRALLLMALLVVLLAALAWAGWHYEWPLLRQHWRQ